MGILNRVRNFFNKKDTEKFLKSKGYHHLNVLKSNFQENISDFIFECKDDKDDNVILKLVVFKDAQKYNHQYLKADQLKIGKQQFKLQWQASEFKAVNLENGSLIYYASCPSPVNNSFQAGFFKESNVITFLNEKGYKNTKFLKREHTDNADIFTCECEGPEKSLVIVRTLCTSRYLPDSELLEYLCPSASQKYGKTDGTTFNLEWRYNMMHAITPYTTKDKNIQNAVIAYIVQPSPSQLNAFTKEKAEDFLKNQGYPELTFLNQEPKTNPHIFTFKYEDSNENIMLIRLVHVSDTTPNADLLEKLYPTHFHQYLSDKKCLRIKWTNINKHEIVSRHHHRDIIGYVSQVSFVVLNDNDAKNFIEQKKYIVKKCVGVAHNEFSDTFDFECEDSQQTPIIVRVTNSLKNGIRHSVLQYLLKPLDKKNAVNFLSKENYQALICFECLHEKSADIFTFEVTNAKNESGIIRLIHVPENTSDNDIIQHLYPSNIFKYKTSNNKTYDIQWQNHNQHIFVRRPKHHDIIAYVLWRQPALYTIEKAKEFLKQKNYIYKTLLDEKHQDDIDIFTIEIANKNNDLGIIQLLHAPEYTAPFKINMYIFPSQPPTYITSDKKSHKIQWKNNDIISVDRPDQHDIIAYSLQYLFKSYTKKEAVQFLEEQDYAATLCFEEKHYDDADIFVFECGDPRNNLVLVRVVHFDPSLSTDTLNKYLYPSDTFKFNKPGEGSFKLSWSQDTSIKTEHIGSKNTMFLIQDFPKPVSVKNHSRPLTQAEKHKIAQKHLEKNGYKELKLLGQGTFGVVYAGTNKDKNRVAIKVVISHNKEDVNREIQESKPISGMKPFETSTFKDFKINPALIERERIFNEHINVPVIKTFIEDENFYVALLEAPLMDADLTKFELSKPNNKQSANTPQTGDRTKNTSTPISTISPINHQEIKSIAKSVLSSLKILHSRGIAHLDIKPANILGKKLDNGSNAYALTDFGLSLEILHHKDPKLSDYKNLKNELLKLRDLIRGTPLYMAPEILSIAKNSISSYWTNFYRLLGYLEECPHPSKGKNFFESFITENKQKILDPLKKIGFKSDIYSLGISLMQIICTQYCKQIFTFSPKQIPVPAQIIAALKNGISSKSQDDINLLNFLTKLTAREPEKRPSAAQALNDPYLKS